MNSQENLKLRAELRDKIDSVRIRLTKNAKVQEGTEPLENPRELIGELKQTINEYSKLLKSMNVVKNVDIQRQGKDLRETLAEREAITAEKSVLESFLQALKVDYSKFCTAEVQYINTIDIEEVEKRINELSERYNELEANFKRAAWKVDFK